MNPSIEYQVAMSSSTIDSSIPMHHKITATEHVTENRDPLLTKKKACESTQMALALVCDASTYQFPGANLPYTVNLQANHSYFEGCFQTHGKGSPMCY